MLSMELRCEIHCNHPPSSNRNASPDRFVRSSAALKKKEGSRLAETLWERLRRGPYLQLEQLMVSMLPF